MGFSWPQLVVVSGLFGENSLMDGILAILEPFSRTFSSFHDGIPAITKPFSRTFLFSRWNLGYHEAILTNFSFFTMELWLSRSLSHELFLFSRWNSGHHEAFLTNFFFFQDGTLAITKPFSRTFSFFKMELWLSRSLSHELFLFSRWNSGYHEAFLTNFFFFQDGILAITKPFSRTFSFFKMSLWLSRSLSYELFLFSRWNSGYHEAFLTNFFFFQDGILEIRNLGEDSFYIYHKEYLHRVRLVKNLAS
jgi:hypothetical protein